MHQIEARPSQRFSAVVERLSPLSPSVCEVRVRVRAEAGFEWIPGQYVLVSAAEDAPELETPYSIASAANVAEKGRFELAISTEGSRDLLAKLAPLSKLRVSSPRGTFLWRSPNLATILIGMGTGLAPLRAMVEAAVSVGSDAPLVLLFGARTESDILWREQFQTLAREHAQFHFEPTLSRPGATWQGRRGRVQDHLAELVPALGELEAYLCGSKLMVDDCVSRLTRELGVDATRVFSEAF